MTAAYDEVADAYDVWVGASAPMDDPTLTELVGDVRGLHVSAIACGQGREARFLAERGAVVTGVELSEQQLAKARAYEAEHPLGITYLQGDAQSLTALEDSAYDGVVCHMALMDIPELAPTLRSVARVLRPGGWFVFSITHPCFKAPATGELVDHVTGTVRRTVGRYFVEGRWEGPGKFSDRLPAVAYHRTLSTYVNELTAAGLPIVQLREPALDTPIWREVPCLLYARCLKPAPSTATTG
ncbi:class I SAM-dependent methyltransferase [Flindersiella endophytica]